MKTKSHDGMSWFFKQLGEANDFGFVLAIKLTFVL
jgi:hypothetical protein